MYIGPACFDLPRGGGGPGTRSAFRRGRTHLGWSLRTTAALPAFRGPRGARRFPDQRPGSTSSAPANRFRQIAWFRDTCSVCRWSSSTRRRCAGGSPPSPRSAREHGGSRPWRHQDRRSVVVADGRCEYRHSRRDEPYVHEQSAHAGCVLQMRTPGSTRWGAAPH